MCFLFYNFGALIYKGFFCLFVGGLKRRLNSPKGWAGPAIAEAAKEALWLKGLVKELGLNQGGVQIHCDSQNAIYLAKNQVYHARTKHIDIRFHKIRELIVTGDIVLEKVHTLENVADMLTKPVTATKFKHCLDLVNVSSL